jgi:hypothetical protein
MNLIWTECGKLRIEGKYDSMPLEFRQKYNTLKKNKRIYYCRCCDKFHIFTFGDKLVNSLPDMQAYIINQGFIEEVFSKNCKHT